MAFTFLHTADWQLGKPFRAFDAGAAALLAAARLDAIDTIAASAVERGARHVLVAGDVFDSEGPSERTVSQALDRLAAARDITWHLLPGNHDPARAGGLWERLAPRLPRNVRAWTEPGADEIAQDVWLLACPLRTRAETVDPTAWLDAAVTPRDAIRIGLAHGSVRDFSGAGESAAIIDPARSRHARLDYLALGDWHGTQQIDARTWYSGTPEPDRYPANDPGFVLAVTLEAPGAEPQIAPVITRRYRWLAMAETVQETADLEGIDHRICITAPDLGRLVLKIAVSGAVASAVRTEAERWAARLGERVLHLDADLDGLVPTRDPGNLSGLELDEDIRRIADRLADECHDRDPAKAQVARDSLALLLRIASDRPEAGR
jgi:DNA repair exonuclease SbcCD nuclease subunit